MRPRAAQPGPPLPPDRLRPPAAGDHPPGRRSRLSLRCFIDDDELSPIMGIERLAARQITAGRSAKFRPSRPISFTDVVVNTSWGLRISSYPRVSPGISRYLPVSRHIPPYPAADTAKKIVHTREWHREECENSARARSRAGAAGRPSSAREERVASPKSANQTKSGFQVSCGGRHLRGCPM